MSYGFNKLVILPSNGIEYPPYAYIKPITYEYFLFASDVEELSLTQSESIFNVLFKYVISPVPLYDLYTEDFYFLYINFLMQILEDKYYLSSKCEKCKTINKLSINIGDISTTYYDGFDISKEICLHNDTTKIRYRRRKVSDNLKYGIKNLETNNGIEITNLIDYISHQIISIIYKGHEIEQSEIKNFLQFNLQSRDISEIFTNSFIKKDFGMNHNIEYKCKSCSTINQTYFFNDFGSCMVQIERDQELSEKITIFKALLQLSRTPAITINELLKMPYTSHKELLDAFKEIEFQALI